MVGRGRTHRMRESGHTALGVAAAETAGRSFNATIHNPKRKRGTSSANPDPMRGLFQWDKLPTCLLSPERSAVGSEKNVQDRREAYSTGTLVEFEPDPDLRDSEQIPLLEKGTIGNRLSSHLAVPTVWPITCH